MGYAFWEEQAFKQTGSYTDLRTVFEELQRAKLYWGIQYICEVSSRGTTDVVLYKHYILRSEGEIFFMYSFHILSSFRKALWWLRYLPSADRRSQSDQSQKTLHSSSSLAPFSSVRCNTTSTKTTAAERFSQQELARCLHIDHLQVKQNSEGIAVFWPPPLQ